MKRIFVLDWLATLLFLRLHIFLGDLSLPVRAVVHNNTKSQKAYSRDLVLLNPPGFLLDRIKAFNTLLHEYRNKNLINDLGEWVNPQLTNLTVVQESGNFLKSASIDKGIALLSSIGQFLNSKGEQPMQLHNLAASDLLITEYYKIVASEPLCSLSWPDARQLLPHGCCDQNGICSTNQSDLINSEFMLPDSNDVLLYLLPSHNSVINWRGSLVHSQTKLASDGCYSDSFPTFTLKEDAVSQWSTQTPSIEELSRLPLYDEVFVISVLWGGYTFYHRIESLTRLAAFLQFLRANPDIKIHAGDDGQLINTLFGLLELDPNRIVTGAVRARMAYIPKGFPCAAPGYVELQLLSHHLQRYVERNLKPGRRDKVILIKRSRRARRLVHYTNIMKDVKMLTEKYGFTFIEWRDNPPKPLQQGFKLFYEAIMVVASHGAGEVNMIASRPGTHLIEVMCDKEMTKFTYLVQAHRLGHRYHGIVTNKGCHHPIDIEPRKVAAVVETHLKQLRS